MKSFIIILTAILLTLTGCIRHTDDGLRRREQKKTTEAASDIKRITPNLMVEDVEASVSFYKSVLGFDMVTAFPDTGRMSFAIVSRDNMDIMFQQKEDLISEIREFENVPLGGSFTIHIDVRDILMIYEKAVLSARIVQELHQTPYGTKEFSIKDNNGYIITFSEPLKSGEEGPFGSSIR